MNKRMVKIDSGALQGSFGYDPRITVFKGVPYAAPPVGDLRWRAPQPVKAWDGVRFATEYADISIQKVPGGDPNEFWTKELHPAGPEFTMSEDCLYLDVYTPAKKGDEKLPVYFYIHGGGLQGGYPHEIEFDWEHMARKGIVVVTPAYRLGYMGFLSHPWLSAEAPEDPKGSYGYLDQLAALKWTKRNIEAFGGDPDKITIGGQSAGAGSVMAHLSSPMSKDLFRAAVIQSGIRIPMKDTGEPDRNQTVEQAEKNGEKLFEICGFKSLEEARACDAMELYKIVEENRMRFSPCNDGIFSVKPSAQALLDGEWGDKPIIFGFNSGEIRSGGMFAGKLPQSVEELEAVADKYGSDKERFLELIGCKTDEEVKNFMSESRAFKPLVISTLLAGCLRDRQGAKAYLYEFAHHIPGEDDPGVYHGAELAFAYDAISRMWRPFTGVDYDMARYVNSYWINFIKTGDPNGVTNFGEELPRWDAYTAGNMNIMKFTDECRQEKEEVTELMLMRLNNGR